MEDRAEKKYELTDETIVVNGHILHRIRALKDFGDVKAGDFGGFVESEDNLSHEGNCWVYNEACVLENARIGWNAKIFDKAKVYGDSHIFGYAMVCDKAKVYDKARVYHTSRVYGKAKVHGDAWISGNSAIG